jgi:hypothetical protein
MDGFLTAESLIGHFKGDNYLHGLDIMDKTGRLASGLGLKTLFIRDRFAGSEIFADIILQAAKTGNLDLIKNLDQI